VLEGDWIACIGYTYWIAQPLGYYENKTITPGVFESSISPSHLDGLKRSTTAWSTLLISRASYVQLSSPLEMRRSRSCIRSQPSISSLKRSNTKRMNPQTVCEQCKRRKKACDKATPVCGRCSRLDNIPPFSLPLLSSRLQNAMGIGKLMGWS
jgi:hypothetical protein